MCAFGTYIGSIPAPPKGRPILSEWAYPVKINQRLKVRPAAVASTQ